MRTDAPVREIEVADMSNAVQASAWWSAFFTYAEGSDHRKRRGLLDLSWQPLMTAGTRWFGLLN